MSDTDNDDQYETIDVAPNFVNLVNLHTIIYNRNRENMVNLVEGVNPHVANDTSEIQEALNEILVEHVTMMGENPDSVDVMRVDDDTPISGESIANGSLYVLKNGDNPICYSKSRYALLICGSNLMDEEGSYGTEMNIVKV
jgi:hypothetical protein